MAYVRAAQGTSSDLSSRRRYLYDVFLSFRGEDTRKTFTDHLYTVLNNAGFNTFRDDHELERGESIPPELQKAIQLSRTSVVVLSNGYASSTWCLDELVLILQRKRPNSDIVVFPVFYDVDPSEVRKQHGSIGKAFARLENTQSPERVARWREALIYVANLAGFETRSYADGDESKFMIQEIVNVIGNKLGRKPLSVEPKLIGIQSQVKDINLWLQDGSSNVGIFVMYGMSGIGKTTIAKHVYNSNFRNFEGRSFIENIKETANRPNGLVQIQMQLLSDILDDGEAKIQSFSEGIIKIEDAISSCSKKVMLVLDGVEDMDQIDAILMVKDRFYPGSKILITTTHESLLKANQVTKVHKVEPLDDNESLELFSGHAFGQDHPIQEQHGGGLPLPLEVNPDGEIMNELRKSFQSSKNDHDRKVLRENKANSAEWIFLITSLCMEILSAACDQASSPRRPWYALFSMLLAIAALLTSICELIYKGMKKNVVWGKRGCHMLFDSDIELFVLVGGIAQCVCSIIQYVYFIKHAENPFKMSLLPTIFLVCLIVTRLCRKRLQTTYETSEHTAYTE
ncbi:unnamed protein product [Malus baccata var. baccata]